MGTKKFFILFILFLIILFTFPHVFSQDGQDFRKGWEESKEKLLIKRQELERKGYTSAEILTKRLNRLRSFSPKSKIGTVQSSYFFDYNFHVPRSFMDITEFQVNKEEDPATFEQLLPTVAVLEDNSFLAVWEDERNGDWDLFSQKVDTGGAFADTNFRIISDSLFSDQILPAVKRIGDSSFVLVWIDGSEFDLYCQLFYPDLTTITENILVSQGFCWSPQISCFEDSTYVIVWRDESDVYARRYNFPAIPFGPSLKVNDTSQGLRFSPSVAAQSGSGFVVVWEDFRDSDGDIYFQRYTYGGSSIGANILANSESGVEDQYQPEVSFGKDGEFMISWVDTKEGNPDIYVKIFFWDGTVKKTDFKVNTDEGSDAQWDPCVGSYSHGKYLVSWTDLRNGWDIYAQIFDSAGTRVGPNQKVSDSLTDGIREKSSLSVNLDGFYTACWEDERNSNNDIYCQRISEGSLLGTNLRLNLDSEGAIQKKPALTTDGDGDFVICWEDKRGGKSDIYMSKFNRWGTQLLADKKVNDNPSLVEQSSPDVDASEDGDFVVAWEDSREGLNIYAQLFDKFGNGDGGNFRVSSDTVFSFSVTPSAAKFREGSSVVVWSGERLGTRDIYAKRYNQNGIPVDSLFKVNDDGEDVPHLNPKVATDSSGNFLVAWYDERDSKRRIYMQRFDSSGAQIWINFPVDSDSTDSEKQNFDLGINGKGEFVVVWESSNSTESVLAQIYDSSGTIVGSNILVTDDTASHPEDPKVYMDPDSYFVVIWTDYREGDPNIYYQIFGQDGARIGVNSRLNQQSSAIQKTASVSLSMSYIYSAWMDNRMPNHGFDIFATSKAYRALFTDEDDLENIPSTFELYQNYPNPFNPTTRIPVAVHGSRKSVHGPIPTTLKIYNIRGQLVRTLLDQKFAPGEYKIVWDGKDCSGKEVSSGIYFYQLKVGEQAKTKKMVLIK